MTGPSWELRFTATGGLSYVERIEGWEVPRSVVDAAGTYGVLAGPFSPGNLILAGSAGANGIGPARITSAGIVYLAEIELSEATT